jgi:predicted NAD-dependent protein-ADP-ribosyltransferase YbiA (DUF1768 family)
LWKITKKYEADEIPAGDDAFGMPIDVEFISIGLPHREYLVPFKLLQDKLGSIGVELCNEEELKMLGLEKSTNMFGDSHKMAAKAGRKFPMTNAVEQFSFLNRWFVFRRKSEQTLVMGSPEATGVPRAKTAIVAPTGAVSGEGEQAEAVAAELQGATDAANASAVAGENEVVDTNGRKQYDAAAVLQFELESAPIDKLRIGDKLAQRWLSPGSPFPIQDPDPRSAGERYPSMEHFLAAMKYKVATDKPGLAQSIFGPDGTIHQKFLRQKQAEIGVGAGAKPLTEAREAALLVEEMKEIHAESRLASMKKWKAKFDEPKWNSVKEELLENAVKQRWDKDARFHTIVEAAKQQGKYLLFFTGSASSEYGGKRTKEGYLEGENKLGKAIMKVAGFE